MDRPICGVGQSNTDDMLRRLIEVVLQIRDTVMKVDQRTQWLEETIVSYLEGAEEDEAAKSVASSGNPVVKTELGSDESVPPFTDDSVGQQNECEVLDDRLEPEDINTLDLPGNEAECFNSRTDNNSEGEENAETPGEPNIMEPPQETCPDVNPSRTKTIIVHKEKEDEHFETQEDWRAQILDDGDENVGEELHEDLNCGAVIALKKKREDHPVQKKKSKRDSTKSKVNSKTSTSKRKLDEPVKSHEKAKKSKETSNGRRKDAKRDDREKKKKVVKKQVGREMVKAKTSTPKMNTSDSHMCNICMYMAPCESKLTMHVRTHTGEKPYACRLCPQKFAQNSSLTYHVNSVHRKKKPFACTYCALKFSQNCNLTRHVNSVHHGLRPFTCEVCGEKFKVRFHMESHSRTHLKKKGAYTCFVCKKKFANKDGLSYHLNRHHVPTIGLG